MTSKSCPRTKISLGRELRVVRSDDLHTAARRAFTGFFAAARSRCGEKNVGSFGVCLNEGTSQNLTAHPDGIKRLTDLSSVAETSEDTSSLCPPSAACPWGGLPKYSNGEINAAPADVEGPDRATLPILESLTYVTLCRFESGSSGCIYLLGVSTGAINWSNQ